MKEVHYGIDVHRLYEAHLFDLETKAKTDRDITVTWREKHGWVPPSEQKKEEA